MIASGNKNIQETGGPIIAAITKSIQGIDEPMPAAIEKRTERRYWLITTADT
jgi:hypothetical protein